MPTEGRRSPRDPKTGEPRKPRALKRGKLSPLDRYQRGREIAALRAQAKPVAWKTVAEHVGLSQRQCQEVYAQFLDWEQPLHDPMRVVDETIDSLTVAMHEAWLTYEGADAGSSVRVQAIRTAMDAAITRLQVMRAAGRAPRSLAAPTLAAEMQGVFRDFAELLRRHDVDDGVLRDFLGLAESRMGRRPPLRVARYQPAPETAVGWQRTAGVRAAPQWVWRLTYGGRGDPHSCTSRAPARH